MPGLRPQEFVERLSRGKTVAAVLLLGSDFYLSELCRDALIEKFVPETGRAWALARFSAADRGWEQIFERAQTLPMLSPKQVLILEHAQELDALGEEAREEAVARFESYLENPAPFTILVIEAAALDQRRRLYRVLSEKALVVSLEVDAAGATALASQMAKELGSSLDREAATLLVENLNAEPARIHTELEKLSLYVQGEGRITAEDVVALVAPARRSTVWQLADMMVAGERGTAMEFLDNLLREGEQPAGLVGAMAWMYRKLIEASELPAGTNKFQAARQLSMHPDSAERALRQAHGLRKEILVEGVAALAEADSDLKSGVANPRAVMEFLLARLTAPVRARA